MNQGNANMTPVVVLVIWSRTGRSARLNVPRLPMDEEPPTTGRQRLTHVFWLLLVHHTFLPLSYCRF